MKITTAMLISTLAFGSTIAFAAPEKKVVSAESNTVVINAVMKPVQKDDAPQFHVNRGASLNTGTTTIIRGRQLQSIPVEGNNPLTLVGR